MKIKAMNIKILLSVMLVLLALSACSGNKPPKASSTPGAVDFVQPTETALPREGSMQEPDFEYMTAQANKGTPWYVRVDARNQLVSVYAKDEDDRYTYLVNRFACSVPAGASRVLVETSQSLPLKKSQWEEASEHHSQYTVSAGDIVVFRSVPVVDKTSGTLDSAVYDALSFPTDKTYIILTPSDAKWMFEHLQQGTMLEIAYDGPDPDLAQRYAPPPYIEGCEHASGKDEFKISITAQPYISWELLKKGIGVSDEYNEAR